MAWDAYQLESARSTAIKVHRAVQERFGSTEGQCKHAAVALALALSPIDEPVALCFGTVGVGGVRRDHAWCRIQNTIIDATADQFGHDGPLIAHETQVSNYREAGFLLFSPRQAAALIDALCLPDAKP